MELKKHHKQGLGLMSGSVGLTVLGFSLITNLINWLWITVSAIFILGGYVFWFMHR